MSGKFLEKHQTAVQVIKHIVNILAAVLSGGVAFILTAYGFMYKSFPFIEQNLTFLISLTFGILCALVLAYIVLYIFKKKSLYRLLICLLLFLDIAALIYYFICATGVITKITSVKALRDYISKFGNKAVILYIIFSFLQVVILPVPGSVTVAAGVALFGAFKCCIYSFIGIVTGSIVAFAIGRWLGYPVVKWIVGKETLDKWLNKVKGKDYLILSLMFLLPMFPDDVLCFIAGLSSMTWLYFIIMIIVTRLISVVTTAYSFELIPFNTWWGILTWIIIFAIVVLAFYLVCKYSDQIDNFVKNKLKWKKKN